MVAIVKESPPECPKHSGVGIALNLLRWYGKMNQWHYQREVMNKKRADVCHYAELGQRDDILHTLVHACLLGKLLWMQFWFQTICPDNLRCVGNVLSSGPREKKNSDRCDCDCDDDFLHLGAWSILPKFFRWPLHGKQQRHECYGECYGDIMLYIQGMSLHGWYFIGHTICHADADQTWLELKVMVLFNWLKTTS